MSQSQALIHTLKKRLRAQGVTYAQVASQLGLSEASIKRQFSRETLALEAIESIAAMIGLDLFELVLAARQAQNELVALTEAQEAYLVQDPCRVLVAVCAMNHWPLARIVDTYRLTEPQCIGYLLELERIGLVRLMPGNRIKLAIARDFAWLSGGPIQQFFRAKVQNEFLDDHFAAPGEVLRFQQAMLTPEEARRFAERLQHMLRELTELHEGGLAGGHAERSGNCVLIAMRSWEPEVFAALRR